MRFWIKDSFNHDIWMIFEESSLDKGLEVAKRSYETFDLYGELSPDSASHILQAKVVKDQTTWQSTVD